VCGLHACGEKGRLQLSFQVFQFQFQPVPFSVPSLSTQLHPVSGFHKGSFYILLSILCPGSTGHTTYIAGSYTEHREKLLFFLPSPFPEFPHCGDGEVSVFQVVLLVWILFFFFFMQGPVP